jgi:hypothetical protein
MDYHSDSAIDVCTNSSADEQDCSFNTSFQLRTFVQCLKRARRIFVLCGAGLSTARGIPNFIDPGTMWRNQRAVNLSNIDTFNSDPGMAWKYFAKLRILALKARPTQAHVNLAELAWKKRGLMYLAEDIDGQSPISPFSSLDIISSYAADPIITTDITPADPAPADPTPANPVQHIQPWGQPEPPNYFTYDKLRQYFIVEGNWIWLAATSNCWFLLDFAFCGLGIDNPRRIAAVWETSHRILRERTSRTIYKTGHQTF